MFKVSLMTICEILKGIHKRLLCEITNFSLFNLLDCGNKKFTLLRN